MISITHMNFPFFQFLHKGIILRDDCYYLCKYIIRYMCRKQPTYVLVHSLFFVLISHSNTSQCYMLLYVIICLFSCMYLKKELPKTHDNGALLKLLIKELHSFTPTSWGLVRGGLPAGEPSPLGWHAARQTPP